MKPEGLRESIVQRHCVGQRLGTDIQGEVLRGLVGALGLLGFGFRLRRLRTRGFGAFGAFGVWVSFYGKAGLGFSV